MGYPVSGYLTKIDALKYIYIYVHEVYATASSVLFSQLINCYDGYKMSNLSERSTCTTHNNHLFLAPYMMDNSRLHTYLQAKYAEDTDLKDHVVKSLRVLASGKISDTPYTKPATSCNNWEENHWTERLYYCISDKYNVDLTTTKKFVDILTYLRCETDFLGIWCLRGSPDMLFHQERALVIGSSSGNDESESSHDESFQRPPLKGKGGAGPPEKLGEAISSVHVILVCKYLRAILNERHLKAHQAKGLMMDKQLGSVQIFLDTDEWEENVVLKLKLHLITDYVQLSHLTKLTQSPPSESGTN